MSERPIRIKSVNINRNNDRTHGFLQTDDNNFDIILVQEPWFGTVANLRSDTDPDGTSQRGFPSNNKWLTFSPPYSSDVRPKVCVYTNKRTMDQTLITNHIPPAPLLLSPARDKRL